MLESINHITAVQILEQKNTNSVPFLVLCDDGDLIYTVKSLDLNADKPIDLYRKEISELESLNYRLDLFSKDIGLDSNANNHYLIMNPYVGSKPSYHNLYNILKSQDNNDYPYSLISTKELASVTRHIQDSDSIKKFSAYLEGLT